MLKKLQKRQQSGFTIIEVLIVLAIAGLIMVIVFLAVPGLQRSQRNNGLSTDANNVLTAVNNYSSNNGGNLAGLSGSVASGVVTITGTGGNNETAKVDTGLTTITVNTSPALTPSASNVGALEIVTGTTAVCNQYNSGLSGTGTARSIAILYVAESGGGTNQLRCVD